MIVPSHKGQDGPQTGPPAPLASPPDPQARPGKRRWLLRLAVALALGAGIGGACSFWPAPRPTVRTLVHIASAFRWARPAGEAPDEPGHEGAQVALVRSRLVLRSALQDRRVASLSVVAAHPDPVRWLEQEVQADFSVSPGVLRIAVSEDNPEELVALVNALREAYIREAVDRDALQRRDRLTQLREARGKLEGQTLALREERRVAQQEAGGVISAEVKAIEKDLRRLEGLSKRLRAEEAALGEGMVGPWRLVQTADSARCVPRPPRPGRLVWAALVGLACALSAFACLSWRAGVSFR